MKNMEVMLDFETMGSSPISAVVQIGAVQFRRTGEIISELLINVSLRDELEEGFKIDADTVMWWMGQENKTWMDGEKMDSEEAFIELNRFMQGAKLVWSHSTFDAPIFFYHNKVLDLQQSVRFTKFVDLRTVSMMTKGRLTIPATERPAGAHDALIDCRYQIEWLTKCRSVLKG
jgi:DNA polymerase III epsilon subunit-like protein